jgi:hypothetical protein
MVSFQAGTITSRKGRRGLGRVLSPFSEHRQATVEVGIVLWKHVNSRRRPKATH